MIKSEFSKPFTQETMDGNCASRQAWVFTLPKKYPIILGIVLRWSLQLTLGQPFEFVSLRHRRLGESLGLVVRFNFMLLSSQCFPLQARTDLRVRRLSSM